MLVLHYTGMRDAKSALQRLCDPGASVSAHYLIDENAEVFALVPENKRAWHAGLSSWNGITDINSASIGIEIVNGGHEFGLPDFPTNQIKAVIKLSQEILSRHHIPQGNIVGHNEIAPDRKLDPGEKFPWDKLAQAGIGLWPKATTKFARPISQNKAKELLGQIGYQIKNNKITGSNQHCLIAEFQRRYRPELINGQIDEQTSYLLGQIAHLTQSHKPG